MAKPRPNETNTYLPPNRRPIKYPKHAVLKTRRYIFAGSI